MKGCLVQARTAVAYDEVGPRLGMSEAALRVLDAEVKFQAGLIGLPLCALGGGVLVRALRGWLERFGQEAPLSHPTGPLQWSGLALAATSFLACSLPLGGAGVVMLDCLRAEVQWYPAPARLVLSLGALAVATVSGWTWCAGTGPAD